jgi:hypothetical protein
MRSKILMNKVVIEREVAVVPDSGGGGGTGSNAVWAIAMVVIVAIVAGVLYYSGALKSRRAPAAEQINVDVKTN